MIFSKRIFIQVVVLCGVYIWIQFSSRSIEYVQPPEGATIRRRTSEDISINTNNNNPTGTPNPIRRNSENGMNSNRKPSGYDYKVLSSDSEGGIQKKTNSKCPLLHSNMSINLII